MAVQPPPDPNRAVLDLILQVREAKSPLARVRVIARAWRTVRALTPKQRYEVAVQLGLDGADDLIEAIASHRGSTPPPELMQAVNEVQKMDPATVKAIAARVRNPKERAEGIKQGLRAIEEVLAGPEPPPAPSWVPKGASPTPPPPAPAAPPPPPPQVVAKPATSWPLREASPAPAPAPKPAPAPVPVPVAAAPAPTPPAPQPPPPAPAPPAPVVQPTPPVAAAPPPPPKPAAEPPREPAPVRTGLAEHLGSIPALTARFRHLRKHLGQVRRLPAEELRALLEVFPDGWARRRALSELIAEGVPSRASDVLSLVDVLQSPRDRAWCLGTLADTRPLSSEERSALLQAAGTPAGRRRLELRFGDV